MSVNRSSGSTSSSPLPPVVTRLIKKKAMQLASQLHFPVDDWEDLVQEITLEVIRRREKEEDVEKRENKRFLHKWVHNAISNLLEHRTAIKRDYRNEVQLLDREILDEDGQWIRVVNTFAIKIGDGDATNLDIDMRAAIAALPEDLADICNLYLDGFTVAEISALRKYRTDKIYRALRKLGRHPSIVGLKKYFEKRSDRFKRFR